MAREEEEGYTERSRWARRNDTLNDEVICPVCSRGVRGDQEIIDAHVNACLADESRRLEEERARKAMQDSVAEEEWDFRESMLPDGAVGHVGDVRGTFSQSAVSFAVLKEIRNGLPHTGSEPSGHRGRN